MIDKTIYTEDGLAVPWFEINVENVLDKTTLIFGGSGSGKTTIIENLLHAVKDLIPNIIVIAPKTSDSAYRKKLPARCIKEDLTKSMLQKIWQRQVNCTQLFNIANDVQVLGSLFMRTPDRQSMVMVKAITQRANDKVVEIDRNTTLDFGQKQSQKSAIEDLKTKKIKALYRNAIRQYRERIKQTELSDKEKIALEYLDLNPRLMIIIDDMTERFKAWMKMFDPKKKEDNIIECLFYKGRWNNVTTIFAAHDDKVIATELRKGARSTIFTTSQAVVASLNKQQSGYTTQEKKEAMKMATRVFSGDSKNVKTYQKLCYIREDMHPFQYTIANVYQDFKLGCNPLNELVCKMPKKDDNLSENPYLKDMFGSKKQIKRKKD